MKIVWSLLLLSIIVSCGNDNNDMGNNVVLDLDSTETAVLIEQTDDLKNVPEQISAERERLNALLANPLNLQNYKAEYGTSNSGSATKQDFFFKPDTVGFYYQYMLFYQLLNILKSHPSESDLFHEFRIIVYKYGEDVGSFYASNEELIGIECAIKNETLGELDLVGMERNEVIERFGHPDRVEKEQAIYLFNQTVLALYYDSLLDSTTNQSKVLGLKLVRVNERFDLEATIPDYLSKP